MTNHKKVGANFVHRPNVLKFDFMRFSILSHLRLELFPAPEFSVSSSPGSQWEEAGQGFLHLHPGPHVHRPKSPVIEHALLTQPWPNQKRKGHVVLFKRITS